MKFLPSLRHRDPRSQSQPPPAPGLNADYYDTDVSFGPVTRDMNTNQQLSRRHRLPPPARLPSSDGFGFRQDDHRQPRIVRGHRKPPTRYIADPSAPIYFAPDPPTPESRMNQTQQEPEPLTTTSTLSPRNGPDTRKAHPQPRDGHAASRRRTHGDDYGDEGRDRRARDAPPAEEQEPRPRRRRSSHRGHHDEQYDDDDGRANDGHGRRSWHVSPAPRSRSRGRHAEAPQREWHEEPRQRRQQDPREEWHEEARQQWHEGNRRHQPHEQPRQQRHHQEPRKSWHEEPWQEWHDEPPRRSHSHRTRSDRPRHHPHHHDDHDDDHHERRHHSRHRSHRGDDPHAHTRDAHHTPTPAPRRHYRQHTKAPPPPPAATAAFQRAMASEWWKNPAVQASARTALNAGAHAVMRHRKGDGAWLGSKGAKVAGAALGAALADGLGGGGKK